MIEYYHRKFMEFLGYRKVWYMPMNRGVNLSDFYKWEYYPKSEKKVYNEFNPPK